jgi:cyanate permease
VVARKELPGPSLVGVIITAAGSFCATWVVMAADVLLSIEAGYLKLRFTNKKLPSVLSFYLVAPPETNKQTNKQTQNFNKKQKEQ